jgi:hypothetical protein
MMMNKALTIMLFALLGSATCFGQSSFQGLIPGKSTRAEVGRRLGQPVRKVSATLAEYKPPQEAEAIYVQYRMNSSLVEMIVVIYPGTLERATVLRSLRLPTQPAAAQTNKRGQLEEYFAPANVVLTYAADDVNSGVNRVGYYSRELFESALEDVPGSPQHQDRLAGADASVSERPGLTTPASRAGRSSTSSTDTSTESEKARTETRPVPSAKSSSGVTIMRTPVELKDGSVSLSPPDVGSSDKEIFLSRERLERLVGKYEFDRPDALSLQEVVVDEVDGKLRWNAGAAKHLLIPTATGQEANAAGQTERDTIQFKLAGKPGAKAQFNLIHGQVVWLLYQEERAGKMITVVGTPKQ